MGASVCSARGGVICSFLKGKSLLSEAGQRKYFTYSSYLSKGALSATQVCWDKCRCVCIKWQVRPQGGTEGRPQTLKGYDDRGYIIHKCYDDRGHIIHLVNTRLGLGTVQPKLRKQSKGNCVPLRRFAGGKRGAM